MRIVDMQRRLRERGRIRLGYSTPHKTRPNVKVPHKLDTFRFTAADAATIEQVATMYGGTPERWEGGADQWQVTTTAKELSVTFATEVAFSQSYEEWQGGYMRRLCDGETALVPSTGRRMASEACACDPENRACQMTTHLKLILPELPGLGTWRLVTHGYNAATELLAAVELIEGALGAGLVRVPARLLIEKRERRRLAVQDDGSTKPVTFKFAVPVLELEGSVAALGAGGAPGAPQGRQVGAGATAALAGPAAQVSLPAPTGWSGVEQAALPEAPAVPMTERLAPKATPAKRRNSPPALPATGRRARTGAQAEAAEACTICGEPYGVEAVVRNPDPDGSKYIHRSCRPDPGGDEGPGSDVEDPSASEPATGDEGEPAAGQPSAPAGGAEAGAAPAPAPPASTPNEAPAERRAKRVAKAAAGAGPRMMSHGQHAKVMALSAKAFPVADGESVEDANARRRTTVLAMAATLGQPGLVSRSDITASTAQPLIDALEAIEAGTVEFDGERFIDTEAGEPLSWELDR